MSLNVASAFDVFAREISKDWTNFLLGKLLKVDLFCIVNMFNCVVTDFVLLTEFTSPRSRIFPSTKQAALGTFTTIFVLFVVFTTREEIGKEGFVTLVTRF